MGESNTAVKDTPLNGQSPETQKASTSPAQAQAPTTYTEEQVSQRISRAVSNALADAGRRHKGELETAVNKERLAIVDREKELKGEIQTLNDQIDELSQDDPDRKRLTRSLREMKDQQEKLKVDRQALDTEKARHAEEWQSQQETIAEAKATNFEIALWDLAEEYDGADAVKLKTACEKAKIIDVEGARNLADVLWIKKSAKSEPLTEGPPDSGTTSGGSVSYRQIADDYVRNPNDPVIKERYLKARRQRGY